MYKKAFSTQPTSALTSQNTDYQKELDKKKTATRGGNEEEQQRKEGIKDSIILDTRNIFMQRL